MPNWCETTISFDGRDTEEGKRALEDFYNKIVETNGNEHCIVFEEMIEKHIVDTMTPLYPYNNNENKRGYIAWINDINYNSFTIVCEDAWTPNIKFWDKLIRSFYGDDKIDIRYQAYEPGMGLFWTNDEGLLPRYNFDFTAYGLKEIMKLPGMFDPSRSYGPFMFLDSSNNCFNYTNYNKDIVGYVNFITDGDEDDVLGYIEECNLGKYNTIEQAEHELNKVGTAYVNEFKYVPVEEMS